MAAEADARLRTGREMLSASFHATIPAANSPTKVTSPKIVSVRSVTSRNLSSRTPT